MNWTIQYRCEECGGVHESQHHAQHCCAPTVSVVFVCSECDEPYDDMTEADECCQDEQEESDE